MIGGGVVGASTAFHLASLGLRRVVLCERRTLTAGATGKSAAHVQVVETAEPEARLSIESLPYYIHWSDLVGAGSCGFERMGYLRVGAADDVAHARRHVELLRGWGVDARSLSVEEVRELAPYLEVSDIGYGHYQPNAGYASSAATTFGFAERASQLGARILERTTVTAIEVESGRVTGVRTTAGTISTRIVVVAAGAWSIALLRELGLDLPVLAARTQTAVLRWPDGATPIRTMSVMDLIHGCYFAPHGADARHLVVGLSGKGGSHRRRIDDLERHVEEGDAWYADAAFERLVARVPAAAYVRREIGWAGPVTSTPDRAPIVDAHPEANGLFFNVGCNGRGFKGAPALGRAIAEWAATGAARVVDLRPFRAERFWTGELVRDALPGEDRSTEYQNLAKQAQAAAVS